MSTAVDVAAVADLPEGTMRRVELAGTPVCLVHAGGVIHALHDTCTHARASLSEGFLDDGRLECPRHGAQFDVATGTALTPPASSPQPMFAVTVSDGRILVDPTPSHSHPFES
ncbi:MAG: non-heme iron oxygenase ferredoxin subunit [Thermoleophilia bacterium]